MPKTILFPTDFSEASEAALPFATSLARDWGATLLIAHVVEGDKYPAGRWFEKEPKAPPEESTALENIAPSDPSVAYERKLLFGPETENPPNPAEEIVKLAEQENVDAIVIGTHGRSGLGHLLMGSVAESVLRHADCPVVTVKHLIK